MKNHIFLLLTVFVFNVVQSQEIPDAVRYAQDNLNGTARFRAMGGAFGALGGDLSSLNVNPAGSAIYSNNQLGISITSFNKKNESNYFKTNTSAISSNFDMNQLGGVFVFKNQNPSSDWKKFSLAVNYENTNDFDNSIFSAGVNGTNSIANYFLSYANGVPLGLIRNSNYSELNHDEQQAFLGYESYIINAIPLASDPLNDINSNIDSYSTNTTKGGNYYQENSVYSNGYNGKLSFNAATSYKDKLYIGMNLNSHFVDYRQSTLFYESNKNALGSDYTVTRLHFKNDLYTYGTGFSFQIGAIAKVTKEVRLGLSFESPIWYTLNDELSQSLTAVRDNNLNKLTANIDPQITNYYAPYKLQTPGKWTGSFAYIFGKTGLISFDYSRKDYSTNAFKPKNEFTGANREMTNILDISNEFRFGAEYKIKEWSLRGGYRFEGSPYKNKTTMGDLNSFSGGFGYNFGVFKLDFAYSNSQRNATEGFFTQGFTDGAKIKISNNNFTMTLLFEM